MSEQEWLKIIDQYSGCEYFIENYVKIQIDGTADRQLFPLRPGQRRIIRAVYDQDEPVIGLCSRQTGKTSVAGAIILHQVITNRNRTVPIAANKLKRMLMSLVLLLSLVGLRRDDQRLPVNLRRQS